MLMRKGYTWLDMSLTAEHNMMINRLVQNLGGQRYKVYRTYHMSLES